MPNEKISEYLVEVVTLADDDRIDVSTAAGPATKFLKWSTLKAAVDNLYNIDGTLQGARQVDQNGNNLGFINDHVSIPVGDIDRSACFYDTVLATVGFERRKQRPGAIGYGPASRQSPVFWIHAKTDLDSANAGIGLHVSFQAQDKSSVDAFHAAALSEGAANCAVSEMEFYHNAGPTFPNAHSFGILRQQLRRLLSGKATGWSGRHQQRI